MNVYIFEYTGDSDVAEVIIMAGHIAHATGNAREWAVQHDLNPSLMECTTQKSTPGIVTSTLLRESD